MITTQKNETFQMYHGGKRWSMLPDELIPASKNRYEGGVGIYLTNKYETARKYAKGSRVVHIVDIDKNYRDIKGKELQIEDVVEFVKSVSGLKHKKEIIQDLISNSKRLNRPYVHADVLNNLIVNYEAGAGNVGLEIPRYFISKGIDASLQNQSGDEQWLVVFNPKIIQKFSIVNPSNQIIWTLPQI